MGFSSDNKPTIKNNKQNVVEFFLNVQEKYVGNHSMAIY